MALFEKNIERVIFKLTHSQLPGIKSNKLVLWKLYGSAYFINTLFQEVSYLLNHWK